MTTQRESKLWQEINEQPQVLARFLDQSGQLVARLAGRYRTSEIDWVLIAARGSSDNAARYGQYALGSLAGVPVALATPSLFTRYASPPRLKRCLVVGISQSGESPDIEAVVREGARQGMPTLAITNVEGSPLAKAAADVLPLGCGTEESIAATKTYTTQVLALAALAAHWAGRDDLVGELARVPEAVAGALAQAPAIERAAEPLGPASSCVTLGRGYNYSTAYEVSLKLKELAYILAEPYSPADFLHGPIALVEAGFPVVAFAAAGPVFQDQLVLLEQLRARGAHLVVVSGEDAALEVAKAPVRITRPPSEWLSPLPLVVAGQALAYFVTERKGLDPDHPRGLRKVTKTR